MADVHEYLESVRHRLIHSEDFMPAEAELPLALAPYCRGFLSKSLWGRLWYVALVSWDDLDPEQALPFLDALQAHLEQNYVSGPPRRGLVVLAGSRPAPDLRHSHLTVWRVDLSSQQVSRGETPVGSPSLQALEQFEPVDWEAPDLTAIPPTTHDPDRMGATSGPSPSQGPVRDPVRRVDSRPAYGRAPVVHAASIFGSDRPWGTHLMLAAIWGIFVIMVLQGNFAALLGEFSGQTLVRWGSQFSPYILQGQWWRLGTAMFLHGGLIHIAVNSYALYVLGPGLESLYGHGRWLFVYLGAGIIASTSSFLMGTVNAIGASGAIFGLMGAYVYYTWYMRGPARRRLWAGIWPTLVINLVIGVTLPFVDIWAHLGGLIGGFALSALVGLPGEQLLNRRRLAGVALLGLLLLIAGPTLVRVWAIAHSGGF